MTKNVYIYIYNCEKNTELKTFEKLQKNCQENCKRLEKKQCFFNNFERKHNKTIVFFFNVERKHSKTTGFSTVLSENTVKPLVFLRFGSKTL